MANATIRYWDLTAEERRRRRPFFQMHSVPATPSEEEWNAFVRDHPEQFYHLSCSATESQRRADIVEEVLAGNWSRRVVDEHGEQIGPSEVTDEPSALRFAERMVRLLEDLAECERAGATTRDRYPVACLLHSIFSSFLGPSAPPVSERMSAPQVHDLATGYQLTLSRSRKRGNDKDDPLFEGEVVSVARAALLTQKDKSTLHKAEKSGRLPPFDGEAFIVDTDKGGRKVSRKRNYWTRETFEQQVRPALQQRQ